MLILLVNWILIEKLCYVVGANFFQIFLMAEIERIC